MKQKQKRILNVGIAFTVASILILSGMVVGANSSENETDNYTLTINSVGSGETYPLSGVYSYPSGTIVSIDACPMILLSGSAFFMYWTGDANGYEDPIEITMDSNKTITANFWCFIIQPMTSGWVEVEQPWPPINTMLTACPGPDWSFLRWSGDISSTLNPICVSIQPGMEIIAEFVEEIPPPEYITITNLLYRWNLVAVPFDYFVAKADLCVEYDGTDYTWTDAVSSGIVTDTFFGWNGTDQIYLVSDIIDSRYGYWLWAYDDCILKVLVS